MTQDGAGNAVQFKAPVAAIFAPDLQNSTSKVFVIDGNGIEVVDIGAGYLATNVGSAELHRQPRWQPLRRA